MAFTKDWSLSFQFGDSSIELKNCSESWSSNQFLEDRQLLHRLKNCSDAVV